MNMYDIDITTPALLFPALSLLLLAYTNRFLGLAQVVRLLRDRYAVKNESHLSLQIQCLRKRITIIKYTEVSGIASMLMCVISMFLFARGLPDLAVSAFFLSLFFMVLSLSLACFEVMLSGQALQIELNSME